MQEEQNQSMDNTSGNDPLNLMKDAPAAEAPTAEAPATGEASNGSAAPTTGHRKVRVGLVVSNKMDKSIVVTVVRRVRHPLYKKYFNKTKKYMAHDENNECSIGDTVRIIETRPLSARKRWRLDAVVSKVK
jgi:small subunit ribosomal protein S17